MTDRLDIAQAAFEGSGLPFTGSSVRAALQSVLDALDEADVVETLDAEVGTEDLYTKQEVIDAQLDLVKSMVKDVKDRGDVGKEDGVAVDKYLTSWNRKIRDNG